MELDRTAGITKVGGADNSVRLLGLPRVRFN